jgi:zinc transport system permease protein
MISGLLEALSYDFMRHALLAVLLASLVCGVVGTLVVVNRMVFLAGGIAHAAYGGIGMAAFFGFSPFLGALGFSLATTGAISAVIRRNPRGADAVVGALWAFGMALGVLFADRAPGYRVDLGSTLFGGLLAVGTEDLIATAAVALLGVGLAFFRYADLLALSFDEEYARSRGVPTEALHRVLLVFSALAIVVLIRVVGLVLVIALLSIPPALAERSAPSLAALMVRSALLSALFGLIGLGLSYAFDLSPGAAIILTAASAFLVRWGIGLLPGGPGREDAEGRPGDGER